MKQFMHELRASYVDTEGEDTPMGGNGIKGLLGRWVLRRIFRKDITEVGLHHGATWFVLSKEG